MNNLVIRISDLKLYKGASSFDYNSCNLLMDKMGDLGMTGVFKNDSGYGAQQIEVFFNLGFFGAYIRTVIKDFIILKDDNFYIEMQGSFETSEALLLNCLKKLICFGCSILPLIAELYKYYPEFKGEFGELEYQFLDIGINILPAMNEIVNILTKLKSDFVFIYQSEENLRWSRLTPFKERIRVPTKGGSEQYLLEKLNKKIALEVLNDSLVYYAENKKMLKLGLETKLEFKFRIKELNLSEEEAILFVLKEVAPDISLETLKFLVINLVIDLKELRERAKKLGESLNN